MSVSDPTSLLDRLMAVKPDGLSRNAWTARAGVNRNVFSDIKRSGNAAHGTIEKLLDAIGVTFAEFEAGAKAPSKDRLPDSVRAPFLAFRGDDRPRDVPVLGTAECGEIDLSGDTGSVSVEIMSLSDEVIDYVRRPAALDHRRDVYAFYYRGFSMEPRFEDGELGYADPRRAPRAREYAIVQLRGPDGEDGERVVKVLAKRVVKINHTFVELEQFNPPAIFRVPRTQIMHIHRVIPWAELVSF